MLAAVTAPGDSGAPVVDVDGQVVGVALRRSTSAATRTAYALTGAELTPSSSPCSPAPRPAPKGTGPCLND